MLKDRQKSMIRSLNKYVTAFFVVLVMLNGFLLYLVNRTYSYELSGSYETQLAQAQNQIGKQLVQTQSILYSIRYQDPIYRLLEYPRMTDAERVRILRDEILPYLDSLPIWATHIDRVRILHADPALPNLYDSLVYSERILDLGYAEFLSGINRISDTDFYIEHLPTGMTYFPKLSAGKANYTINLYLPLYSRHTLNIISLAQVSLKADMLMGQALDSQNPAFLTDEDGKLIWNNGMIPDDDCLTFAARAQSHIHNPFGRQYLVVSGYNESLRANMYKVVFLDPMFGSQIVLVVIIVAVAVMILLMGALTFRIYRPFRRQVTSLADSMTQIRLSGDLRTRVEVSGQNEFTMVSQTFNEMLANTELLMQRIVASGRAEKHAVYASLSNQIRPHFLNNALDRVRMMARNRDEKEIARDLEIIMRYLSYNLGKQSMAVSLAVELSNVKDYIQMYELSGAQSIALSMNVKGEARGNLHNFFLPKFTLLPVVENCIHHGFVRRQPVYRIIITVIPEGDLLNIQVEDNGGGMEDKRLMELRAHLADPERGAMSSGTGTGIGLGLIYQRLKLYYGTEIPFAIESHLGVGTLVSFTVPKSENEELME